MTPNEITTLFATKYGKELDVPFKLMLYERVKMWRATLIKQSIDKSRKDSKYFRQTIYLPMAKVNTVSMAPELTAWAASTVPEVPIPVRVSDSVFDYVGGIDGKSPFGYADAGTISYLKSGKYARKRIFYDYINKAIVVSEVPSLPILRIDGVFNSPEEAYQYQTMPAQPDADWWNMDIPMSGDVEQRVIQCMSKVDYEDAPPSKGKTDDQQVAVNDEEL